MTAGHVTVDPNRYLRVLHDAYTKHYSERTDEWTDDLAMRCVPALIQGQLKLSSSTRVLDIGCGSGRDVEYLARVFESVVGIDIFEHDAWKRIVEAHRPRATFRVVDFLSYQPLERYHLILDNGCFHHQHEAHHVPYLRKAATMLVPDGWLVLSTFNNPYLDHHVDANGRLHHYFADDELNQKFESAGLEVVRELEIHRVAKHDSYRLSFSRRQR